jgi:hypothetical protein
VHVVNQRNDRSSSREGAEKRNAVLYVDDEVDGSEASCYQVEPGAREDGELASAPHESDTVDLGVSGTRAMVGRVDGDSVPAHGQGLRHDLDVQLRAPTLGIARVSSVEEDDPQSTRGGLVRGTNLASGHSDILADKSRVECPDRRTDLG